MSTYIFDFEVFLYDWLVVFKSLETGLYTIIHNNNEAIKQFMEENPTLCGFNNKHYDAFILKGILAGATPQELKLINDLIIVKGVNGWEIPMIKDNYSYFEQYDLMDDVQQGMSLKAIEAHFFMDIRESQVDFNIDRPLTEEELEETIFYCKHDVDATEMLWHERQNYLKTKVTLGNKKNLTENKSLYMTNAKLTAVYLDAQKAEKPYTDEREYVYPDNILYEYIPSEVIDYFNRMYDKNIPDKDLFGEKLDIVVGGCPVTIGYGGIHGAIPTYREKAAGTRSIRNQDVASYYPHLVTIDGYCSRNIPNPKIYEDMLETRMKAKKAGDKETANALKLVANTTYGAMLNQYNDLYDPLMGRSVCITGQLRLLELANHLISECPTLKIIQLNTDGIMISLDDTDLATYQSIVKEWQNRTGFELEEDCIAEIIQKDVNNYIEVQLDGSRKIKGGLLVRGVAQQGAFKVNNNMTIVSTAIINCLVDGTPCEETINNCNDMKEFQLVAKASGKYSRSYHLINGQEIDIQKCNRVYATKDTRYGTLYKVHADRGTISKIENLPEHCIIDNNNELNISVVDKKWYIRQAKKYVNAFLGVKPPKKNTRRINQIKKEITKLLEE